MPKAPGQVLAGVGVLVGLSLAAVLAGVVTFAMHTDATRSAAVQQHGIPASGTTTAVKVNTRTDVSEHYGERTVISSVDVRVKLDEPVQDVGAVTVHVTGQALFSKGEHLRLLLDPEDPRYAELPGHPRAPSRGWLVALTLSLGAWLTLVVATVRGTRP